MGVEGQFGCLCAVVLAMKVTTETAKTEAVGDEGIEGVGGGVRRKTGTEDLGAVSTVEAKEAEVRSAPM